MRGVHVNFTLAPAKYSGLAVNFLHNGALVAWKRLLFFESTRKKGFIRMWNMYYSLINDCNSTCVEIADTRGRLERISALAGPCPLSEFSTGRGSAEPR